MAFSPSPSRKIPLTKFFVWIGLLSSVGFFLGQYLSPVLQGPLMAVLSFQQQGQQRLEQGTPQNFAASSPSNSELALKRFLKEREDGKAIAQPEFKDREEKELEEYARRKYFAEYVVHPTLLIALDDNTDAPTSITIAVDFSPESQKELVFDVLQEIYLHASIKRITILLVSESAEMKSIPDSCDCFPELLESIREESSSILVQCRLINPKWGYTDPGYIKHKLLPKDNNEKTGNTELETDVSIVLSGCDDDSNPESNEYNRRWEKELYSITKSVATTCSGIQRKSGGKILVAEDWYRIETIRTLFVGDGSKAEVFPRIVDYDIYGQNIVVAFRHKKHGISRWHWNEAQYSLQWYWRLSPIAKDDIVDSKSTKLMYFDAPDFLRLQFPTKQSVRGYCTYMKYEEQWVLQKWGQNGLSVKNNADDALPNEKKGNATENPYYYYMYYYKNE